MGGSSSRNEPYTYNWEKINRDASGELAKPIYRLGFYSNPFDTFEARNPKDLMVWKATADDQSNVPWYDEQEMNRNLPVIKPDMQKILNPPRNKLQMMWIGHATLLVQFDGLTVLTDPVFSKRCGPLGMVGHQRYRDAPCEIEDLPCVDAVIISHNHYDHMDFSSIRRLKQKFEGTLKWFVPSGLAKWLRFWGCSNVTELSWWEESTVEKGGKTFTFVATPAQHYSWRFGLDLYRTLWCGWVIKGPAQSFYFTGDTGYCFAFKQIGRKYGPFSLAAIPIGAYEPRWFMRPHHICPEEAVYIHKDVQAMRSVGVHWGTFKLTDEHYMEPKKKLDEYCAAQGLQTDEFFTVNHGQVVTVDLPAEPAETKLEPAERN